MVVVSFCCVRMPLPFTPFEEYMLLDDSPSYPMDSLRLLRFVGEMDVRLLFESIKAVVQQQPMLRSIVKKTGGFRFVWEEINDAPLAGFCTETANFHGYPQTEPFDLFKEPGFKCYVTGQKNETRLLLQFHHCVSDGIGEMEIVGDILTEYANRFQAKTHNIQPFRRRSVDASLLPLRGKSGLTLYKYFRYYFDIALTSGQLLFRYPKPLLESPVEPESESATENVFPTVLADELTPHQTRQFFRRAQEQHVTVNDLLVQKLFLAMFDWRKKYAALSGEPLLRISIPMNLRTEVHQGIPASNTVTMVFLDRKPRDGLEPEKLLAGIHQEMEWIKRTEQKHVLPLSLFLYQMLPGVMAWTLRKKRCRATAVLSNLGRTLDAVPLPRNEEGKLKAGLAVLDSIDASPPLRPGTQVSFSALTYADCLRLILRYDSKMMPEKLAADLLQLLMEHIKAEKTAASD